MKRQILSREEGRGACFSVFSCCGNWIESLFDDRDEELNFRFFPLAVFAAKRFFLIEMRGEALPVFSLGGRRKIAGSREHYEAAKSNS